MSVGDERQPGDRNAAAGEYALGRLRRAIETAMTDPEPETRERAEQKALAWESVLSGLATGSLSVGSRTPLADTPAWVTLEVVHGGFATGRLVAESPLDDAERLLLARVADGDDGATDRMKLNCW